MKAKTTILSLLIVVIFSANAMGQGAGELRPAADTLCMET